jgi:transgelin
LFIYGFLSGLAAVEARKLAAKFEGMGDMEIDVRDWMKGVGVLLSDDEDIETALKDGMKLCELANAIKPGFVKKVWNSKISFKVLRTLFIVFLT